MNEGAWTNARVVIDGVEDQAIEIGGGLAVPEVVFESGLQANTYQWFRDGEPILGETSPTLTFATLVGDDNGSYWCDGDGILSRTISVTANAAGVSESGIEAPAATMLGAARPNPFRGATMIDFALDSPAPVRLSAFDVAGRLVAVLVDERRSAGRHDVSWQTDDLAPGVYFLRLRAGSTHVVRKVTRLK
jgi:Secretion system C-terminal sorting domain